MRPSFVVACALLSPPLRVTAQRGLPALPVLPVFEGRAIALSPGDSATLARGEPVVQALESRDTRVVAVFGMVAANVSRGALVSRLAAFDRSGRAPSVRSAGVFRTPATPENVAAFRIGNGDATALKACRSGACEFKLPAAEMARAKVMLEGGAGGAEKLAAYARRRAAEYVNGYRARGNDALVTYDDYGPHGVRASEAFTALLDGSPWILQQAPAVQQYLLSYPRGRPPGTADVIYWIVEANPGLRPTLTINHRVVFSPPDRNRMTVAITKQLFASHYFEAALEQLVAVDRAGSPRGEATYVMLIRQYRFDNLPGVLNIRGRAKAAVRERVGADLRQMKAGDAPAGKMK